MAKVTKWGYNFQIIVFNQKLKKDNWAAMTAKYSIYVIDATLDSDTQCMHCGKSIKKEKLAFLCFNDSYVTMNPRDLGDNGWGEDYKKNAFCSNNHAKLFAKNSNGG
jgi:hypothetical protein